MAERPQSTTFDQEVGLLWLYRIPGFGAADPRNIRTTIRVLLATGIWVGLPALLGMAWASAFGFGGTVAATAEFLWPIAALAAVMAIEIYWFGVALPIQLVPALEAYQDPASVERDARAVLRGWTGSWQVALAGATAAAVVFAVAALRSSDPPATPLISGSIHGDWFGDPLLPRVILALAWGMPVGALIFTGTHGLARMWQLVIRLADHDVVDRPLFVLPRLRHIVLFGQFAAMAWSTDVLLFYIATFWRPGMYAYWLIFVTTAVGFASLALPHVAFHLTLRRMESRLSGSIRNDAELALAEPGIAPAERLRVLTALAVDPPITWPYDLRVLASLTALGPIASALVGLLAARR